MVLNWSRRRVLAARQGKEYVEDRVAVRPADATRRTGRFGGVPKGFWTKVVIQINVDGDGPISFAILSGRSQTNADHPAAGYAR